MVYAILIGEAGSSRATVITYVNPVVAVGLGVALLGERPGAGAVAGLLLILAGGWLSTDGRLPPGVARLVARRRVAGSRPLTRQTTPLECAPGATYGAASTLGAGRTPTAAI